MSCCFTATDNSEDVGTYTWRIECWLHNRTDKDLAIALDGVHEASHSRYFTGGVGHGGRYHGGSRRYLLVPTPVSPAATSAAMGVIAV